MRSQAHQVSGNCQKNERMKSLVKIIRTLILTTFHLSILGSNRDLWSPTFSPSTLAVGLEKKTVKPGDFILFFSYPHSLSRHLTFLIRRETVFSLLTGRKSWVGGAVGRLRSITRAPPNSFLPVSEKTLPAIRKVRSAGTIHDRQKDDSKD